MPHLTEPSRRCGQQPTDGGGPRHQVPSETSTAGRGISRTSGMAYWWSATGRPGRVDSSRTRGPLPRAPAREARWCRRRPRGGSGKAHAHEGAGNALRIQRCSGLLVSQAPMASSSGGSALYPHPPSAPLLMWQWSRTFGDSPRSPQRRPDETKNTRGGGRTRHRGARARRRYRRSGRPVHEHVHARRCVNNSGHPCVEYVGASNPVGVHRHHYLHVTGGAIDHYTTRTC